MKDLWIIVIIALIIRIVLSLVTFHSDMEVFDIAGRLVASGNILNVYDFTSKSVVFNYPPLIYLFHGLFAFVFSILGLSNININLFLLKLPYLIFDLLIVFILLKIFDSRKQSLIAIALWLFNPVNLYATYMMGQFDIIPTFSIILSGYFVVKNKLNWAAIALGIGIAFKLSPIFLVVPLIIFGKNFWQRIKLFILALMPYLLSIIPFLPSSSFRSTALFANQNSKSLYANIPVSGGESIILFPVFLLLFYLIIWNTKKKLSIWSLYSIPLLLFFIFTHFHPQWLIWLTPFLILDLVRNGIKNIIPILLVILTWFASLFFFDPSLTVGIFSPITPALKSAPSIWELLHINMDYNSARSLIQTVFVAAGLYFIVTYLHSNEQVTRNGI